MLANVRFGSFASIWPTRATSAIHPIATEIADIQRLGCNGR